MKTFHAASFSKISIPLLTIAREQPHPKKMPGRKLQRGDGRHRD
jgi:hypothetical protein